jgi:polar amino acid transport system substrate-binding protein
MHKLAVLLLMALLTASCATTPPVAPAIRAELAPTGTLRAGLNFQNALLTAKGPFGEPRGVAVDLARELARRLGVPLEIVPFSSAGALAGSVKTGKWDVAFLGDEPQRANEIAFTDAYAEIDATYLVPAGSKLRAINDVDRKGVRIVVPTASAYDLYLSRSIRQAQLVRIPGTATAHKYFVDENLDALAGLRPTLLEYTAQLPGSRLLDGRFTVVRQAAGTIKGRDTGAQYLREFIEDVKASGLVAHSIEKNGAKGLSVAPKAAVR